MTRATAGEARWSDYRCLTVTVSTVATVAMLIEFGIVSARGELAAFWFLLLATTNGYFAVRNVTRWMATTAGP